jgi:hypothetical protein
MNLGRGYNLGHISNRCANGRSDRPEARYTVHYGGQFEARRQ